MNAYLQQQFKWDYDLVSLAADARVTGDGILVGLQVPRTMRGSPSWEPKTTHKRGCTRGAT